MKEESIQQERIPRRILPGGDAVPAIGLGTFGSDKYGPEEVARAVYGGIRQGYRLIDCAAVYQNEAQVGEALEHALKKGSPSGRSCSSFPRSGTTGMERARCRLPAGRA